MASTTNSIRTPALPFKIKRMIFEEADRISDILTKCGIISGSISDDFALELSCAISDVFKLEFSPSATSFKFEVTEEHVKRVLDGNNCTYDAKLFPAISSIIEITVPIMADQLFKVIDTMKPDLDPALRTFIASSVISTIININYHFYTVPVDSLDTISLGLCKTCCSLRDITPDNCSIYGTTFKNYLASVLSSWKIIDKLYLTNDFPSRNFFV